jgi:hypothetical protein
MAGLAEPGDRANDNTPKWPKMEPKSGKRSSLVFPIFTLTHRLALQVVEDMKDTKRAFLLAL